MTITAVLGESPAVAGFPETDVEDEFTLDVKVVVATHPNGKLQCSTSDGCGNTCQNGASACNSYVADPF
ncbi:FxLD family lanthipeptide [Nocardiopsis sp. EMB25]|uniref:FxLD family lanthipeptide n=1 Tax=Nocardiopsis sp. EMB25 TaxID=2835867 RepID=UPI00228496EA|nr:FxLD family lanthipeptide [Nocardiopsis sp. EMB25]MCY9784959.1 FxLD family lanthipeptide [Nocardiopsis sp. EMB25]